MNKNSYITDWESKAPKVNVTVTEIEHFDARGKVSVFGRGEIFSHRKKFDMTIWKTKNDRLLMRFWSTCKEIYWESHEIKGIDIKKIPVLEYIDIWIPDDIRLKYEDWIEEQYWD